MVGEWHEEIENEVFSLLSDRKTYDDVFDDPIDNILKFCYHRKHRKS